MTNLRFLLKGRVGSWYTGSSGPNTFDGKYLETEIVASSVVEACEQAQEKAEAFLREHKDIAPAANALEGCDLPTFEFTLTQLVWEMRFIPGRKEVPAIPPREAQIKVVLFQ